MNNETKLILEADYKRDGLNHFWLIVNGETVAYLKACYEATWETPVLNLSDIETREGYRGMGYSKEIMSRACKMFNVDQISHSGGYTALGYERVFKNVKYKGSPEYMTTDYDPMTFVDDWDKHWPKY